MNWLNELLNDPLVRAALMLSATACAWELIRHMKERDQRLLRRLREDRERRDGQRIAAIAQRVSKLRGAGRPAQQGVPDGGPDTRQVGSRSEGAKG